MNHRFAILITLFLMAFPVLCAPAQAVEPDEPRAYAPATMATQGGVGYVVASATSLAGGAMAIGSSLTGDDEWVRGGALLAIGGPLITTPIAVNATGWLMGHQYRHLGAHLGALAMGVPTAIGMFFLARQTGYDNPLVMIGIYSLGTALGSVAGYHIQADRALNLQTESAENALGLPLVEFQMQF